MRRLLSSLLLAPLLLLLSPFTAQVAFAQDSQPAPVEQAAPLQPGQPSQAKAPKDKDPNDLSYLTTKSRDDKDNDKPLPSAQVHNPILWQDPGNIVAKNLLEGPGGSHQPRPPFIFLDEDKNGTNPKFNVRDANGDKWRVKVGAEARPEVAASRILWAVGYFANEDFFVPESHIPRIRMSRGSGSIHSDGTVEKARFSRHYNDDKKLGTWEWKNNPFVGSREFNGLRVMMALINGWDLKDVNNAVYQDKKSGQQVFLASDIGATFGTNGLSLSHGHDRGNVNSFKDSRFITHTGNGTVDFGTPVKPTAVLLTSLGIMAGQYSARAGMQWIGRDIPIADARWIGSLLAQLSHQQLEDAFHAGGFSGSESDEFVAILESRIAELKHLGPDGIQEADK